MGFEELSTFGLSVSEVLELKAFRALGVFGLGGFTVSRYLTQEHKIGA